MKRTPPAALLKSAATFGAVWPTYSHEFDGAHFSDGGLGKDAQLVEELAEAPRRLRLAHARGAV